MTPLMANQYTVLVVDDSSTNLEVLFSCLDEAGFTVHIAQDGETAIYQAENIQPNLILLDVMMPGLTGFETCHYLKSQDETKGIPVILMTALTDIKDKVKGFEVGAVDYITKPFEFEEVLARINTHLALHDLQKHVESKNVRLEQEVVEYKQSQEGLQQILKQLEHQVKERTATQSQATNLARLNKAGQALTSTLDLTTVLERVLEEASALLTAEGCTVLLLESTTDKLVFAAVTNPEAQNLLGKSIPLNSSIAGSAILQQRSILVEDAQNDQRFYKYIDTDTGLTTHSILAVPLICGEEVIGVLETINKIEGGFNQSDLDLLEALANSAAIAIQNAQLFEQLQAGRERLRILTNQVVSAQEEERQRLSYKLHDDANQTLTALKMRLELILRDYLNDGEAYQQHLSEAVSIVDLTMEQLLIVAKDLRPPALDTAGLNSTLEGLCLEFAEWAKFTITYQGTDVYSLSDPVQITLYRCLQEMLNNATKHAQASQVSVTLNIANNLAHLKVQDNGRGFDKQILQNDPNRPKGIGLLGMGERLELLDGWLEIVTTPGQGTCLTAHIPVEGIK